MKNYNLDPNSLDKLAKEELLEIIKKQNTIIDSFSIKYKKYRDLFDNSMDGFYRSSSDGRFIEANDSLVKMLGYKSKEELFNIDINTQLYVDLNDRKKKIKENIVDKRQVYQLYKKDGTTVWVEDSGKKIFDESGNLMFFEGVIRDVSERKKLSKVQNVLLKISEASYKTKEINKFNILIHQQLSTLIDTTNFYIALYNEKKQTINIPFISGEVADEEFPVGKSMTGYLIKNKKSLFLKSNDYKDLIESGEIELIGKFPEVWLGVPLRVEENVIGAIVVQSYDNPDAFKQEDIELLEFVSSHISLAVKRKKITEDIIVSKEVLRKVLDNIPIEVFWKNKDSEFLGCNKAFLRENSIKSEDEVIGKSAFDFQDKEIAQKYKEVDALIMSTGKPMLNYEDSLERNGKKKLYIKNKLPFYDDSNKVIGVVGTLDDITDIKENERKLKQATDEAIAANLSKSTFLSNMSHEIRTPMNAILGYSQLLQDDKNLTKAQHENLKTINKSGEHLLALINDILDMSKIEAGRITLKPSHFNFNEVLKEVELLFKIRASQKNLKLEFIIENEIPRNIFADESKIKQVIINLLGNAIKFTNKGFVSVYIKNLGNNEIRINVKDSGRGIMIEEQQTVFKPFEQAQKGEQIRGGTGLGLAISKKFSHLMDGDITVESIYGEGSTFSFTFKFIESEETAIKNQEQELQVVSLAEGFKGLKVAIVDDRFENRDILEKKLKPLGFDTRMAENGLEAVDLYNEWKPDIILMDVVMPVMNGVAATRKILAQSGDHDVKIFVVSASALESEQKEIMEIGATVFIKKPVIFKSLLSEMHTLGGVEFIYNESGGTKEDDVLTSLKDVPLDLREKLLSAASEGDFMLLEDLLIELEKETNKSFKYIEECINEMEFENLVEWLKQ